MSQDPERAPKQRRFWLRTILIAGTGIVLPPIAGLILTISALREDFSSFAELKALPAEELATAISLATGPLIWGLTLAFLFSLLLIVSLLRFALLKSKYLLA